MKRVLFTSPETVHLLLERLLSLGRTTDVEVLPISTCRYIGGKKKTCNISLSHWLHGAVHPSTCLPVCLSVRYKHVSYSTEQTMAATLPFIWERTGIQEKQKQCAMQKVKNRSHHMRAFLSNQPEIANVIIYNVLHVFRLPRSHRYFAFCHFPPSDLSVFMMWEGRITPSKLLSIKINYWN